MNEIGKFLSNHKGKKVVAVQGLGFVGSVMSLVCANALHEDYAVLGVDRNNEKGNKIINMLNKGVLPIKAEDPSIEKLLLNAAKNKNFLATNDESAFSFADIIIVDINLDVKKQNNPDGSLVDFDVDLQSFKSAMITIGSFCKYNATILIETTVPPGTCKNIVQPIIYEKLEQRGLSIDSIKIGHSYERVMPGPDYVDSIRNFYRVYSGIDEKSENAVEKFLKTIIKVDNYPLTKLSNTNATEMAKVLENSYRAMNIAFMVEWSRFAEKAEVDIYSMIDAIRLRPTHSNMMYPGIGVGGYCLTKDSLLASWSNRVIFKNETQLNQSEKAIRINDQMPYYAYKYLSSQTNLKGKKITILGVSYRGDVGDTRSSPVEALVFHLEKNGCQMIYHDPYVQFWEEKGIKINSDISFVLSKPTDILIISAAHSIYKNEDIIETIEGMTDLLIYDTIGLLTNKQIEKLNNKHEVKVLGRGDL